MLIASCAAVEESGREYRQDFQGHFDQARIDGVFVAYDPARDRYLSNDLERMHTRFIPASTFKVLNALVALETDVLEDEDVMIPWDGVDRGWSMWNKDHDMRSAIACSAVWFFQELARRIGEERMQAHVDAVAYGNCDIGGGIDHFWLDGALRISAYEQVQFLGRLQRGELPFSERSMEIVRDILLIEECEGRVLRGKTGWAGRSMPQIGWFVGYVEGGPEPLFFAINIDIVDEEDGQQRMGIARRILGDLGALEVDPD